MTSGHRAQGQESDEITLDEQLFRNIVDRLQDAVFIHAEDGRILYVNERMLEMHGLPDAETVRGMNIPEHFAALPDAGNAVRGVVERMWREGKVVFEWVTRHYPEGEPMDIELMLHPLTDSKGRRFFFAQARDIRERKRVEAELRQQRDEAQNALQRLRETQAELERLARTDVLTNLHNRREFIRQTQRHLAEYRRYRHPLGVILLDIDHFKAINDSCGHLVGDAVLARVARVIESQVRDTDIAARLGGEEFAVLLPCTGEQQALAVAERIRCAVEAAAMQGDDGRCVEVRISAGVCVAGENDRTFEDLLRRVDQALYRAKADGRNRVRCA